MDMLTQKRKIQHSLSTLSIDSCSTINEDGVDVTLPNPINLTECNEELAKYQAQLEIETKEIGKLSQNVKNFRRQKEPLMKIKDVLQNEIAQANEIINMKSEEVTQLKNKLRHHSEKQIQNNIERLEHQLRINNYKPKEEQKILDEITMLQRSSKTLKEYNLKELENKKYRSEKNRLIEQRNDIYCDIRLVYGKEDKEKRELNKVRKKVAETTKIVDHLLNCRSDFEQAKLTEKKQKDEMVKKKLEEKARTKKDQYLKRQDERRKLWAEYEASREPYEEEKVRCKLLIGYMEKLLLPSDKLSTLNNDEDVPDGPKVTLTRSQTAPAQGSCESRLKTLKSTPVIQKLDGTFYSKQKEEDSTTTRRMSKKEKAKAKKELKVNRSKTLSHPPEVLADLFKMNLPIPKTSLNIPHVMDSLKSTLESYYVEDKPTTVEASTSNLENAADCSAVSKTVAKQTSNVPIKSPQFTQMNGTNSDEEAADHNSSLDGSVVSEAVVLKEANFADIIATSVPRVAI